MPVVRSASQPVLHRKTVLDNGTRLITERVPSRLASVGIWVEVGSRDENPANSGSAHFLEHMFFKGTRRRDAQQIAREFDILGGMSNAFTSVEHTCYYATVLDDRLAGAVDLLADIFCNSLLSQEEIELERQVILQEIAMVEDTPDDRVHELFGAHFWGEHPLGNTVLGRAEVVAAMDRDSLQRYLAESYLPSRLVIAAAGNVDHDEFVALSRPWLEKLEPVEPLAGGGRRPPAKTANGGTIVAVRPLEQEHLVLGCAGLPAAAPERYQLLLLNTILGGNMSSRLFQEVREKRGLAYSIFSYLTSHADSGYVGIYMGVEPDSLDEALSLVHGELRRIRREEPGTEELAAGVDYLRAGMYLAAENMEARMNRLARNELTFGRDVAIEEVVAGIEAVTPEDLQCLAKRLFEGEQLSIAAIGPVEEEMIAQGQVND